MMELLNNRFNLVYFSVLLLGLALAVFYADNQILTSDQSQMLHKGYLGAASGTWLSYGNASSVVGNVPGSLSAVLVGWPLMLWDSPWSPMLFLLALRLVGFFLLDAVVKDVFSRPVRLVFLVAYWLNPWMLYDSHIHNPSYLSLFAAMHIWSAWKMRRQQSAAYSFIHVAAIGMAMQVHFSWPVLACMTLYLFYRKMIRVSWTGVALALTATIASLLPYFQELLVNEAIRQRDEKSDRYIGWGLVHVYPVIKAFIYWLRYSSFLFTKQITGGADFQWLTTITWLQQVAHYLWLVLMWAVGLFTLYFSYKSHRKGWQRIRTMLRRDTQSIEAQDWLLLYAFSAVAGILISASLSPIVFSYWHLILIFPFSLLPLLVLVEGWQRTRADSVAKWFLASAGFFIAVNLVAAQDSHRFSYTVDFRPQVQKYVDEHRAELYGDPTKRIAP